MTGITAELIEFDTEKDRVEARRHSVGASESPALFGLGYEDQTPLSIYAEKVAGRNGEKTGENLLVGTVMEPSLRQLFTHITGVAVVQSAKTYRDRTYPRMTATPDGIVDDNDFGVLEMKMIGRHQSHLWQHGSPLRTQIQLQHQMAVTGLDYGWIFGLAGTEVISERHERNDEFIEALRDKVQLFWACVEERREPDASGKKCDHQALRALHPDDSGESKLFPQEMEEVFEALLFTTEKRKSLEKQEDAFKAQLQQFLGDATYGEMPDGRSCSWKTSTSHYKAKEAFDMKKRTFRTHKTKR